MDRLQLLFLLSRILKGREARDLRYQWSGLHTVEGFERFAHLDWLWSGTQVYLIPRDATVDNICLRWISFAYMVNREYVYERDSWESAPVLRRCPYTRLVWQTTAVTVSFTRSDDEAFVRLKKALQFWQQWTQIRKVLRIMRIFAPPIVPLLLLEAHGRYWRVAGIHAAKAQDCFIKNSQDSLFPSTGCSIVALWYPLPLQNRRHCYLLNGTALRDDMRWYCRYFHMGLQGQSRWLFIGTMCSRSVVDSQWLIDLTRNCTFWNVIYQSTEGQSQFSLCPGSFSICFSIVE